MKKEDAKALVLQDFRAWCDLPENKDTTNNGTKGYLYFLHLETARSPLLDFKSSGDKWQVVHGWLLNAKLVSD